VHLLDQSVSEVCSYSTSCKSFVLLNTVTIKHWGLWPISLMSYSGPLLNNVSLQAGSPLSHAWVAKSKAIWWEGVWWRGQESELALISVFIFSALPERSEIPLVEMQERWENCQSIIFDEEWLDPHGVGNLLYVLSIRNKSSTFGVRGRVECRYYWCFNKVPVYFWLNFKLKREQEIAVESC